VSVLEPDTPTVRGQRPCRERGFEPVDLTTQPDQIRSEFAVGQLGRVLVTDPVDRATQRSNRATEPIQTIATRPE